MCGNLPATPPQRGPGVAARRQMLAALPTHVYPPNMSTLIEATDVSAGYGRLLVLRGVSLKVLPGEIVLLLGPNGAGKTTTLLTLAGELPLAGGMVSLDEKATTSPLSARARHGLGLVTEGRSVFTRLTVAQNLRLGRGNADLALSLFPELRPRLDVKAGLLSGGEQQMLSLGRALARSPRVLLADELSLGLAPLIVRRLLEAVRHAANQGLGVLLVEQHIRQTLPFADRVYVMRQGRIELEGTASEIHNRLDEVERSYLSGAPLAKHS
jgi:branched-chain amino acid transport system ATP-binding protein